MKYEKLKKYENIYSYKNSFNKTMYRVRFTKKVNGRKEEYSKSGFSSVGSAVAHRDKIKGDINNISIEKNKKVTVKDYYKIYLDRKINSRSWTPDTLSNIEYCFRYIIEQIGEVPLSSLNKNSYQKFINYLLFDKDFSLSSTKLIHETFKTMLVDAIDNDYLDKNRLTKIEFNKKPKEKKKYLTLDEFNLVVNKAKEVLQPYLYAMFYMTVFGLRRGEVNGIRRKDIDFLADGQALLHVEKTRVKKSPDGKDTKTISSNRTILIDHEGAICLQYALNESARIRREHNQIAHNDDFLFISSHNKPFAPQYLTQVFDKVTAASGIHLYPHMMRHTFATHAAYLGAQTVDTAKFLGHKKESMTQYYTHATPEGREKLMSIMESRLKKVSD